MKRSFASEAQKAQFITDVKEIIGESELKKEESLSFISSELRFMNWKKVSNLHDLEDTLESLGFKIRRIRKGVNTVSTWVSFGG